MIPWDDVLTMTDISNITHINTYLFVSINYQKCLFQGLQSTQVQVVRSLNDAEEAKHSFLLLKKEADLLLSQLQVWKHCKIGPSGVRAPALT